MTPFTEEQHLVFRLARCGWTYMPSLELIRAHRGFAERVVAAIERDHAEQPVTSPEFNLEAAEARMQEEFAKLLKPEALARLREAEQEFTRRVLEGS